QILEAQGKPAEAQRVYEGILATRPREAWPANNLAWLYAEHGGNLDVALRLAQTAKELLPNAPQISDTLGWIYYKKHLADTAIPALQASVKQDPRNPVYRYHLGLAYLKSGDVD